MKKNITRIAALGISAMMMAPISAFAVEPGLSVDKLNYLYTTGMQLDLSSAEEVTAVKITNKNTGTAVENSYNSDGDILTVEFNEKLNRDTIYKFDVSIGEDTVTKYYRLNTVFSEDFEDDSWVVDTLYKSGSTEVTVNKGKFTLAKQLGTGSEKGVYSVKSDSGNKYLKVEKACSGAVPALVIDAVENKEYTGIEFDLKLNHEMSDKDKYSSVNPITEGVVLRYAYRDAGTSNANGGNSTVWYSINNDGTKVMNTTDTLVKGNIGFTMVEGGTTTIENYTVDGNNNYYGTCSNDFNASKYGAAGSTVEPQYTSISEKGYADHSDWAAGQYHYAASITDDNVAASVITAQNSTSYENVKALTDNDYVNESGAIALYLKGRYVGNKLGTDLDNIFVFDVEELGDTMLEWNPQIEGNTVNVSLSSSGQELEKATLAVVSYTARGKMIGFSKQEIKLNDKSSINPVEVPSEATKVIVYLWDDMDNIKYLLPCEKLR